MDFMTELGFKLVMCRRILFLVPFSEQDIVEICPESKNGRRQMKPFKIEESSQQSKEGMGKVRSFQET